MQQQRAAENAPRALWYNGPESHGHDMSRTSNGNESRRAGPWLASRPDSPAQSRLKVGCARQAGTHVAYGGVLSQEGSLPEALVDSSGSRSAQPERHA